MKENEKIDFAKLMNEKPLVKVTAGTKMAFGQLFGFMTFGEERGINVSYPVWSHRGSEVQFVLFTSKEGKPCIDNDWVREDRDCMYTNVEPIIVKINTGVYPSTFQQEIASYFTKP